MSQGAPFAALFGHADSNAPFIAEVEQKYASFVGECAKKRQEAGAK